VALAVAISAATAACGDDENSGLNGSLSFNHSGAISGSFSAVGRFPLFGEFGTSAWAMGSRDDQNDVIGVIAVSPGETGRYDMIVLAVPRVAPGSATIDANCSGAACAVVSIEFGLSEDDSDFSHLCFLDAGTVSISSISDTRVSGSFSGTGTCTDDTGATTSFGVTSGSFNVPLISGTGMIP
jgi:hypothetical protein